MSWAGHVPRPYTMFQRENVPKTIQSHASVFPWPHRVLYSQVICFQGLLFPWFHLLKSLHYQGPMFPGRYISKVWRYFWRSKFQGPYFLKALCFQVYRFIRWYVPRPLYFTCPLSRKLHIPRLVLYFKSRELHIPGIAIPRPLCWRGPYCQGTSL